MKKSINLEQFNLFLQSQGYDSSKIQYISRDCDSYKIRNIETGRIGYIRY